MLHWLRRTDQHSHLPGLHRCMPGALPVLNKQVVHCTPPRWGKATGCTINQLCKADRKGIHYFTPICLSAYQIRSLMCRSARTARYSSGQDGVEAPASLERIHFEDEGKPCRMTRSTARSLTSTAAAYR